MNSKRGKKANPKLPQKGRTVRRRSPQRTGSSNALILDVLQRNIMFREVEPAVLRQCGRLFSQRHYDAGDLIFDEYSKGRDLFLIASGRVRIKKYTKFGVESLLAVLHPGDFFGEMSLIDGLPRSARAEAVDDSEVLILSADNYRDLVHKHHQIAFNLLNNLALRLRSMDQNFVMELGRNILASRSRMDRLNMLVEASKIVNSALDLGAVLALILDVATRSVGADRGTVYLVDQKADELWSLVASGDGIKEIRLSLGKGLAGYVARTGETVNIVDAYSDPRFNPEIDLRTGYTTHTVLCMPLRNRDGHIVGVFQLLNKRTGHFGPEDESFLDALSIHAAIAIENARLAQEMVNNERLTAVGRMAATILHDIRNPITTMRVYAGIIKNRSDSPDAARMADAMIHQVDRLSAMVQEILEFSNGTTSTALATSALSSALELVLPTLETELATRKISLLRQYGYDGEALIDPGKFSRVITNLIGNAADAMPDGGTITIRTSYSEAGIAIDVTDTGSGIPEDTLPRLFEPFFTQGKKHGTGLGLSIVKRIMEDHHGTVEVFSTPGQGSTFRLLLPPPPPGRF